MRVCKIEGCCKPHYSRGFCAAHHYHWKNGKPGYDPEPLGRVASYGGALCVVDGCEEKASDKGCMCGRHGQRFRRYGDASYVTTEERRRELSRAAQLANVTDVKPTTYRKLLGRHEHRRVAEEKLGRKLLKGEIVHHIDENRHNNHPDNLMVLPNQSEHLKLHRKTRNER
jgi:hypothetical protein